MEKELAIKDQNSFTIHGWMRTKLNLSGNALMIYSIIFGFSQDAQSAFYGTRQYLSDFIGASRPTVDKALNELCFDCENFEGQNMNKDRGYLRCSLIGHLYKIIEIPDKFLNNSKKINRRLSIFDFL